MAIISTLHLLFIVLYTINAVEIVTNPRRSWQDAENYCVSTYGTHLVSLTSSTDTAGGCSGWIGLYDTNNPTDNSWSWIAGDVVYSAANVNWNSGDPEGNTNDCAYLTNNGKVRNNKACTSTNTFCCISPVPSPPVTPAPTAPTTKAPTTRAPTTKAPTSSAPTAPTTQAPTSNAPTDPPVNGPCPRIRREWNTATQEERDLYINGMKELYNHPDGNKLAKFTEQHGVLATALQAHWTGSFLPWHRAFLYGLETQIRDLGGDYECFGLFYWNWSKDVLDHGNNFRDYEILNSGLGSSGDPFDNNCVQDGEFGKGNYVPFDCSDANGGPCCLRRDTCPNNLAGCGLVGFAQMVARMEQYDYYGSDTNLGSATDPGFRERIEGGPHGAAHCDIGNCGGGGHLGDFFYSPDDPVFYLLHTNIDYWWALWQDINDYDLVDKTAITESIYDGDLTGHRRENNYGPSRVDDELDFSVLSVESWWSLGTVTNRDMHSISDYNVQYEKGSTFDETNIVADGYNINSNWFVDGTRRRRLENEDEDSFTKVAYKQLKKRFGDKMKTEEGRREFLETWSQMECEYQFADQECGKRPKYFDDCSDMEIGVNPYSGFMDIDITLSELIEKVADYPCMVATRERMYEWALQGGSLLALCRGEYDQFCDKSFINQKNQCLFY